MVFWVGEGAVPKLGTSLGLCVTPQLPWEAAARPCSKGGSEIWGSLGCEDHIGGAGEGRVSRNQWRHAGTDGRSTAEPGRPVLLFQQRGARAGVPPDFPCQAPGLVLGELQWEPCPQSRRCPSSRGRSTNAPGQQQRRQPCREPLALLSAENSLGQERSPVPLPARPPLQTAGTSRGTQTGHPEHQDDPRGACQGPLSPKLLQKSLSQLLFGGFFPA